MKFQFDINQREIEMVMLLSGFFLIGFGLWCWLCQ